MRFKSHWTPRYIWDRVREIIWQRRHPTAPWITPGAVPRIERLLRPTDIVFEWGAGRSTRWFAERTARVTSIEHKPEWHERVQNDLEGFEGSRCVLMERDEGNVEAWTERYVSALGEIEPGPVDIVLVDGAIRDLCALSAVAHVAPGGVIIVDDVQRALPSRSRTPSSRSDFATPTWEKFDQAVAGWQRIWVTSGVTDTAIWLHPENQTRT